MSEKPPFRSLYVTYLILCNSTLPSWFLGTLYLPPVVGPRLSLKSMCLDLIRKDSKLQSRMRHTPVSGERTFIFVFAMFISFSFFSGAHDLRARHRCFGVPGGLHMYFFLFAFVDSHFILFFLLSSAEMMSQNL